jgi:ribosomal protein L37AE/L43A
MTEDFTDLPLGSLVSAARPVIRCPICQRHGALERGDNGVRRCVHVEVSSFAGNRLQTSQTDVCPIAGPRPESFADSVLSTAS